MSCNKYATRLLTTKTKDMNIDDILDKYEIILKLFFGSKISYQHNKERVTDFLNNSKQKLETAEEVSDKLLKIIDEDDDHFYYYLTTLFGKHIYKAYINWAEEVNQLLDSKNDGN